MATIVLEWSEMSRIRTVNPCTLGKHLKTCLDPNLTSSLHIILYLNSTLNNATRSNTLDLLTIVRR